MSSEFVPPSFRARQTRAHDDDEDDDDDGDDNDDDGDDSSDDDDDDDDDDDGIEKARVWRESRIIVFRASCKARLLILRRACGREERWRRC